MDASDQNLLTDFLAGKEQAFRQLSERHLNLVYGVALRNTGDPSIAEEVVQDVFVLLSRKARKLTKHSCIAGWLYKAAQNIARDARRKSIAHQKKLHRATHEPLLVSNETVSPNNQLSKIDSAVEALPDHEREAILLRFFEDQDYREIAQQLSISEATARKRVSRGINRLHSGLQAKLLTGAALTLTAPSYLGKAVATSIPPSPLSLGPLTTMTTTLKSTWGTAATIAACLTLGYHAASATRSETPRPLVENTDSTHSSSFQKQTLPKTNSSPPDSPLVKEWQRLQKEFGTAPEAFPLIHEAIKRMPSTFQKRALFSILIGEWRKTSPETGAVFYAGISDGREIWQTELFAKEWVAHDGWRAIDTLTDMTGSIKWNNNFRNWLPELIDPLLPHIKERSPKDLARLINLIPTKSPYQSGYEPRLQVKDTFALLTKQNLEYALSTAKALSSGHQEEVLSGIASAWAEDDGPAALKWAETQLEGTQRDEIIRNVLSGWAKTNPAAALDHVGIIPPGNGFLTTAQSVIEAAAEADLGATLSWIRDHPKTFGHRSMQALSDSLQKNLIADPKGFLSEAHAQGTLKVITESISSALLNDASVMGSEIWDWLSSQKESSEIIELKKKTFSGVSFGDPESAIQILNQMTSAEMEALMPDDFSNQEEPWRRHQLLGSLLGRGRVHQLDHLLSLAKPEAQKKLLRASFTFLKEEHLHDPHVWVDRISLLDATASNEAIASLSRAWSKRNPLASLDWVESLPTSAQRESGLSAAISGWFKKESHEASIWVEQLPVGDNRDIALAAIAQGSGQTNDSIKWIDAIDSSERKVDTIVSLFTPFLPIEEYPKKMISTMKENSANFIEKVSLSSEEQSDLTLRMEKLYQEF